MGEKSEINGRTFYVSAPLSVTLAAAAVIATGGLVYDSVISNPHADLAELKKEVNRQSTAIEILKVRIKDCE